MSENLEVVIFERSYFIVLRIGVSLNSRRKLALDAGYHPISLLHLHLTWNLLLSAKNDMDLEELRNVS